jgi:hypothetical protein
LKIEQRIAWMRYSEDQTAGCRWHFGVMPPQNGFLNGTWRLAAGFELKIGERLPASLVFDRYSFKGKQLAQSYF